VSGVDVSDEMVALARQRLPEAAERLLRAELDALPFDDGTFDAAVASGVLEYAGARRSLAELVRVLRPGGRLVVTYPNPRTSYGIWKTRAYYPLVRFAKRVARRPPMRMAPGVGEKIDAAAFESLLREAGVVRDETRFVSYLILLSPLDELLPGPAERLGRRFEGSPHHWLATQVVYAAGKPE
jgi:ubiquinone/menaquinone biosynthesis C-methylase UbiE